MCYIPNNVDRVKYPMRGHCYAGQQNVNRNFLIMSDVFVYTLSQHCCVVLISNRCQSIACFPAVDRKVANLTTVTKTTTFCLPILMRYIVILLSFIFLHRPTNH